MKIEHVYKILVVLVGKVTHYNSVNNLYNTVLKALRNLNDNVLCLLIGPGTVLIKVMAVTCRQNAHTVGL